jgi:hypothetical protein
MKTEQVRWTEKAGWEPSKPGTLRGAQLVTAFGSTKIMRDGAFVDEVRAAYPEAHVIGCSTAGEICDTRVSDESLVITAVQFDSTKLEGHSTSIADGGDSVEAGERLAKALTVDGLVHVFVLSDGLHVNGSDLVKGLTKHLPDKVTVTGGLSGDGADFTETLVAWDGKPTPNQVAIVGLYGDRLRVGYGSLGGWDSFGPERTITRSEGNVLYQLDDMSALELYKEYLGEHAEGLPATGLLFPLSVRGDEESDGVVRTILAVDEEAGSLTFAGDVPEGWLARLMKANFNRLVDGAAGAAKTSFQAVGSQTPQLAFLISCVGRKMVLKQRIEEEVEAVREVLGKATTMTGFYSYGEISPFTPNAKCELHNQTMTITTLSEV